MTKMIWEEAYRTGIRVIDEDHKMLFSIINNLIDETATKNPTMYREISSLLEALLTYVNSHFIREEHFLEQFGYPDIIAHRHMHDALRNQLHEIVNDFQNDPESINLKQLTKFLTKWLSDHILKSDMDYVPYLSGVKQGIPIASRNTTVRVTVSIPKNMSYLITELANQLIHSSDTDQAVRQFSDAYFNGTYKK